MIDPNDIWHVGPLIRLELVPGLKMANKEATIYIVDVGRSMGRRENGREQTNLEWSMQYVWDKITTTVSTAPNRFFEYELISLNLGERWQEDTTTRCSGRGN